MNEAHNGLLRCVRTPLVGARLDLSAMSAS
jgi:hypothetical protein